MEFVRGYEFEKEALEKLGEGEFERRVFLAKESADEVSGWEEKMFFGSRFKRLVLSLSKEEADKFLAMEVDVKKGIIVGLIEKGVMI